jgi:hypothetical protein
MSAVTASLGISSFTSGTVTKVSTSAKVTTKVLTDYSGAFSAAANFDPLYEATVEGSGTYPSIALGVISTNIPSTITGGIILCDSYTQTEKNDEFQSWKYTIKAFPSAS